MVTVKLDQEGSYTQSRDGQFYQEYRSVGKVVDIVGAGDGFATALSAESLRDFLFIRRLNGSMP
jgi:sugar/nucleoside kinase (ribokinase family)